MNAMTSDLMEGILGGNQLKNIVITGSTRGIGFCMAREFLKSGCRVTVSGRSEKSREAVMKAFSSFRDQVVFIACDVKSKSQLEHLWDESVKKWGSVDCWINNAGQNCPHAVVHETGTAYVDAVIDTNIKGMIFGSQVAAKNMMAQGSGQIWNMEGLGSNNMIIEKTILYGTTKAALTYFTKGLAKELAGTPVLAGRLSPGMMLTDFITKTPDGEKSTVTEDKQFRQTFNILADKPETVAAFFIPRILSNTKNNAQIVWLTSAKAAGRFMTSGLIKRKLL
jgi:NAD(P)-dependent dehydrogenase (short-subunit alcohol dehydrogenase family)